LKSYIKFPALCFLGLLGAVAAVPASAGTLYDNSTTGPTGSYQYSGSPFADPFAASNSFTLGANSTITQIMFGDWVAEGDTLNSVDWAITTEPFAGTTVASGTASSYTTTLQDINTGWAISSNVFSIPDLSLGAGTYYLQLDNAVESTNYPTFWDISSGPSTAYQYNTNFPGAIELPASETFAIYGTTAATPEPSSLLLLGSGIISSLVLRRRMRAERSS
jgi:hypothetical protein